MSIPAFLDKSTLRFVLINGPAGSGKDTAANAACEIDIRRTAHLKFAHPIKRALEVLLNITPDFLERHKDDILPDATIPNYTYRRALIDLSEEFTKPRLGDDAFGKLAYRRIINEAQYGRNIFIFSDSGFFDEANYLVKKFSPKQFLLIKIIRAGYTFENDSRSYIELPNVTSCDISNNGTVDDFRAMVRATIINWLDATKENDDD